MNADTAGPSLRVRSADTVSTEAPHHRLRWAMHGTLALLAVLMALACWSAWRDEQRRTTDGELINLAGAQRMLSQRTALLASAGTPESLAALDTALARARSDALRIETLLGADDEARLTQLPPALTAALRRWQDSRGRLWHRADTLARNGARHAGQPEEATARPLQVEAEHTLAAAEALVQQIQVHASQKADDSMRHLGIVAVLGALSLLGLSVGLVEPMARRLRRQHGSLTAQAEQMSRLALVAERTDNVVLITDAQRRTVWANEAFSRVSGYALAEAIGRTPGELLQTEGTDPAAVGRMRTALDNGQGVRVELLNRGKTGRAYWLDIDIQPLHDAGGVLTGFIAVETDITEQVYQRQRLRALLDALPTGVVEEDSNGLIVEANLAAQQVLGLTREQICGRSSVDERWRTVHDDLSPYPGDQHPIARSLRDGVSVRGDSMGVLTPDGEQRWILVNSEPLRNPAGAVHGAVACFVDVTEQRAQRTLLQLALNAAAIGTWEWRPDTGERRWSPASCQMLGYAHDEFQSLLPHWRERIHPDDRPQAEARLLAHMQDPTQPFRCDLRLRHRAGHWMWLQAYGSVVERDVAGRAQRLVGVHIDISERKLQEQQLQFNATHDALTGLPNRAALMLAVQQVVVRWRAEPARHFALMFLDFDRFKQVNDTLGHAAGDELLRQIAERLQSALREGGPGRQGDTLARGTSASEATAARLGGDEFVVLLADLNDPADAKAVADRLLRVLARPYDVRGQRLHSSASIGMVTSAQRVVDADGLLRDADTAMYEAKRAGRGRWAMFEPRLQTAVPEGAMLEADPHGARPIPLGSGAGL